MILSVVEETIKDAIGGTRETRGTGNIRGQERPLLSRDKGGTIEKAAGRDMSTVEELTTNTMTMVTKCVATPRKCLLANIVILKE